MAIPSDFGRCEHGVIDDVCWACAYAKAERQIDLLRSTLAEKDEYVREVGTKCLFYERAWDKQAERLAERERQLAAADLAMQQIQSILRIRL